MSAYHSSPRAFIAGKAIPDQRLEEILQRQLQDISHSASDLPNLGCLLAHIGDYLVRSVDVLAKLAEGTVHGRHINVYTKSKIQDMEQLHNFSEMNDLDYLDEKHDSLKEIVRLLQTVSTEIDDLWDASRKPPFASEPLPLNQFSNVNLPTRSRSRTPGTVSEVDPMTFWTYGNISDAGTESIPFLNEEEYEAPQGYRPNTPMSSRRRPRTETIVHSDSPGSEYLAQEAVSDLINSLAQRGTGSYVCPYGASCRKGGVKDDGTVVIFGRNSAFRAHLQKHEKKYKCFIPRCNNKSGFARPDQLRRHQEIVPHDP